VAAFFRRHRIELGDLKQPFYPGLMRDLTDVLAVER